MSDAKQRREHLGPREQVEFLAEQVAKGGEGAHAVQLGERLWWRRDDGTVEVRSISDPRVPPKSQIAANLAIIYAARMGLEHPDTGPEGIRRLHEWLRAVHLHAEANPRPEAEEFLAGLDRLLDEAEAV